MAEMFTGHGWLTLDDLRELDREAAWVNGSLRLLRVACIRDLHTLPQCIDPLGEQWQYLRALMPDSRAGLVPLRPGDAPLDDVAQGGEGHGGEGVVVHPHVVLGGEEHVEPRRVD